MFESLSDRLSGSLRSITGKARLTEENISETLARSAYGTA
jgi:signal recognition particle subunit SRP54